MKLLALPGALVLALLLACQPEARPTAELPAQPAPVASPSERAHPFPTPEQLQGIWRLTHILGQPVVENSPARIQFTPEGNLYGNASCNRFFGSYEYTGASLTVANSLGATKMLCLPGLMEQESQLLGSLGSATSARLEREQLVLRDLLGNEILRALPDTRDN